MAHREEDGVVVTNRAAREAVDAGTSPVSLQRLWTGVLLAPGCWVVLLLAGYFLAAHSCDLHEGVPFAGTSAPGVTHVVLSAALAALAVVGLLVAVSNWRVSRRPWQREHPAAWGRAEFMAVAGILGSAVALFAIVLTGLSGFAVQACSQLRS
jgi:hypothetical protein